MKTKAEIKARLLGAKGRQQWPVMHKKLGKAWDRLPLSTLRRHPDRDLWDRHFCLSSLLCGPLGLGLIYLWFPVPSPWSSGNTGWLNE